MPAYSCPGTRDVCGKIRATEYKHIILSHPRFHNGCDAGLKNPDRIRAAEEMLLDYGLRYRTMAENTTLGMFQLVQGSENRILSTNAVMARMLGYDRPGDLAGRSLSELVILPGDLDDFSSRIRTSGSFTGREIRLRRRDGSEIWVSLQAWVLAGAGSPVSLIEGFAEDITEHKVSEQEMQYYQSELGRYALAFEQTNRKLNMLSSITRHDILNQITGLRTFLELSREDLRGTKFAAFIEKEDQAAEAIQRQIEFTRFYQDIGVNSPIWYHVRTGIEATAGSLSLSPDVLSIEPSTGVSIHADPLIEKVFYNLLENALRHGGEQTRITFSSRVENAHLVLVCRDNGPGVPARYKEDIFNRKYFTHTGFGLFLSREILGITGLSIRETGEPGKGACFEIAVPQGSYNLDPPAG